MSQRYIFTMNTIKLLKEVHLFYMYQCRKVYLVALGERKQITVRGRWLHLCKLQVSKRGPSEGGRQACSGCALTISSKWACMCARETHHHGLAHFSACSDTCLIWRARNSYTCLRKLA